MKIVFICAPYTASTNWEITRNIVYAESYARMLASNGVGFVCPHTNSAMMHDVPIDPQYWYDLYIEILSNCDAILTIGSWQKSAGCLAEVAYAEKERIPIFDSIESIIQWAKTSHTPAETLLTKPRKISRTHSSLAAKQQSASRPKRPKMVPQKTETLSSKQNSPNSPLLEKPTSTEKTPYRRRVKP